MEVVCEDVSKPLSVEGLTADETFSELPEELGGASMKVTPLADEKQAKRSAEFSPSAPSSYTEYNYALL